ncbi:MAG: response regulator [Bdellovibrionales bacterium]|jgi:DNA-binding response OmpR family regulator|nr:response regulator [Bdellovibrionales bacterium]
MTSTPTDDHDQPRWILVADDEPAVRQFVERALNYAGYAVTAVPDGNAALAALEKRSYDLLLTDIVMPDLDGIALALNVSKHYPQTRILMMTGYSNQRERAHNLDCLAHEVISKPFTLEEITRRISSALAA